MFSSIMTVLTDYIDAWKLLTTGLFSGYIFHLLAVRRATREARRNAAITFYNGIRQILLTGGLLPPFDKMPPAPDILPNLWPQIQLYVDDFIPFVPKKKKDGFQRAWSMFMYGQDDKRKIGRPDFFHYWQDTGHLSNENIHAEQNNSTLDETFECNLNKLLNFATKLMV